jgi:hypothetical protein
MGLIKHPAAHWLVAASGALLAPFGQHAIHDDGCKNKEAQRHHDQDNY